MAAIKIFIGDMMDEGYFYHTNDETILSEVKKYKCPIRLFEFLGECENIKDIKYPTEPADISIDLADEQQKAISFMANNFILASEDYIQMTENEMDKYGNRLSN